MLNIKELGFENIDEIEFIESPKIDGVDCKEDLLLVIENDEEIPDNVVSILASYDCPSVSGLVIASNGVCKIFLPNHIIHGGEYDKTFRCLQSTESDTNDKYKHVGGFVELVNEYDLHHLLIIEQDEENKEIYKLIY